MTERQPRPAPLSLRLTPELRLRVDGYAAARGMSRHGYILWLLETPPAPVMHIHGEERRLILNALSAIAAKVGRSNISNNINQIAKQANAGYVALTPEIEADLTEAVRHVAELRRMLVEAIDWLGAKP